MSNMSYCRFRNTEQDLQDCYDAVSDLMNDGDQRKELCLYSRDEYRALQRMVEIARDFITEAEDVLDIIEDEKSEYND